MDGDQHDGRHVFEVPGKVVGGPKSFLVVVSSSANLFVGVADPPAPCLPVELGQSLLGGGVPYDQPSPTALVAARGSLLG